MILFAFPAGASGRAIADSPESAAVRYTAAPGEIGSPIESVTVTRKGADRTLTISHQAPDEKPRTETVPLTAAEFDSVWKVVASQKLTEFTPDPEPGTAFDYGRYTLHTEAPTPGGGAPRVRETSWVAPLRNQERITPLISILGRLARTHGKQVKLSVIVPSDP